MKAFVVLASCLAVASAGGRGNFGGPSSGGNSGGNGSGGYSNPGSNMGGSSGSSGYSNSGSSPRGSSGSGGYSAPPSGGSGGYSAPPSGGSGGFGNSGLTMSSLMSLLGGGGGFGLNGGFGGSNGFEGQGNSGSSGNGFDNGAGTSSAGMGQQNQQGGQIRRFVSVHVAPEENAPREARVIRAGGAPDTHVNIIFVKAPSGGSEQQTEVVLPEPPKQKTLVYVLIKRPAEGEDNFKIRAPPPTKPSKPEVYFIRYKPEGDGTGVGGGNGASTGSAGSTGPDNGFGGFSSGGSSGSSGNAPSSSYGAPSQQQNGGGSNGGGYQ